jgi:hypothetical protein
MITIQLQDMKYGHYTLNSFKELVSNPFVFYIDNEIHGMFNSPVIVTAAE